MAKARVNKKMGAVIVDVPECPVCLEPMSAPIFVCLSGHSLCSTCTSSLCPAICPICRQAMTQMRSWALEELIAKAKVKCPNNAVGCVYTMMSQEVEDHLKECIFREMVCPLGARKCSWTGKTKDMMQHFKERHPENCNINTDSDIELDNIVVTVDDCRMFLLAQGKMLFIVTVKIDTILKMAYWIVQHIGSKKTAQQHVYEIHVNSEQDNGRKVIFNEYCFNDVMKPYEIYTQGKCGIMPLQMLNHFIKDKKMLFKVIIKRIPSNSNRKFEKDDGGNASGATGKGKKGPGPRGPGPNGPRQKSPGPHNMGHKNNAGPKGKTNNNHPFNFINL